MIRHKLTATTWKLKLIMLAATGLLAACGQSFEGRAVYLLPGDLMAADDSKLMGASGSTGSDPGVSPGQPPSSAPLVVAPMLVGEYTYSSATLQFKMKIGLPPSQGILPGLPSPPPVTTSPVPPPVTTSPVPPPVTTSPTPPPVTTSPPSGVITDSGIVWNITVTAECAASALAYDNISSVQPGSVSGKLSVQNFVQPQIGGSCSQTLMAAQLIRAATFYKLTATELRLQISADQFLTLKKIK